MVAYERARMQILLFCNRHVEGEDVAATDVLCTHAGCLIVVSWVCWAQDEYVIAKCMNDVWLSCQACDRHLIVLGYQAEFLYGKNYQALEQAARLLWIHHSWKYSRNDWKWYLMPWSNWQGENQWKVGLRALAHLFQHKCPVILWLAHDWHVKPLWLLCNEHMISMCWPHNCHMSCVTQA